MEENTEVVIPSETTMNPTNQPVSFYGDNSRSTDGALLAALAIKDPYAPALDGATNSALGCARDQIGDLKFLVKDAEADIRSDIKDVRFDVAKSEADVRADIKAAECATIKAVGDSECHLSKEILENKFALTKEILESKYALNSEIIKQGYENKLLQKDTVIAMDAKFQHLSERLGDKLEHGFEEVNEKLCSCCEEAAIAAVNTQNGLLNISNALNQLLGTGLK